VLGLKELDISKKEEKRRRAEKRRELRDRRISDCFEGLMFSSG
jgi:hypothetical protein